MGRPARILPVIIVSQFACTSIWFAGNAVMSELQRDWNLAPDSLGHVTSAVQLGFIAGTLVFAILALADRFSPRKVFFGCSLSGAAASAAVLFVPAGFEALLMLRFLTGFFLAGIYPVGMKIAAGWYAHGLGRALGFLVGALVLGTAFPHLLRALGAQWPWPFVIASVSVLAALGGVLILLCVPDGPHLPQGARFNPGALARAFRLPAFRASACGYFGHMWELYAFWAFVPVWLAAWVERTQVAISVPLWSFIIIAAGFFGCALGGLLSMRWGSTRVAAVQLTISGICCLASPWLFDIDTGWLLAFLVLWGVVVVGDSPQFSALNAATAPREYVGSALTLVNCIGFAITVVSVQVLTWLLPLIGAREIFLLLVPGPLAGLFAMRSLLRASTPRP